MYTLWMPYIVVRVILTLYGLQAAVIVAVIGMLPVAEFQAAIVDILAGNAMAGCYFQYLGGYACYPLVVCSAGAVALQLRYKGECPVRVRRSLLKAAIGYFTAQGIYLVYHAGCGYGFLKNIFYKWCHIPISLEKAC